MHEQPTTFTRSDVNTDGPAEASSRWTFSGTATADVAGMLRRRLHAWLEQRGLRAITDDVVLAAYEAMANSVEHAYAGTPGPLTVTAVHDAPIVTVTVSDIGEWNPPSKSAYRGRGLDLAERVSDRFDIDHDRGPGTTVTLGWDTRTAG